MLVLSIRQTIQSGVGGWKKISQNSKENDQVEMGWVGRSRFFQNSKYNVDIEVGTFQASTRKYRVEWVGGVRFLKIVKTMFG